MVVNRWLDDGATWHEFPSTATVTKHVDGLVLIDEYDIPEFPTRGHVTAVNIRAFDAATAEWQLVWLASYCAPDMRRVDERARGRVLPGARVRRRQNGRGAVPLSAAGRWRRPLGAGAVMRRGRDVGGQLDDGFHARMTPAHESDGRSDFDFLYGTWDVLNRKLRRPLTDPSDWEVFATTAEARPILQGLGNFDRFTRAARPGAEAWEGCTLRLFDPETAEWSIHWTSTKQPGRLDPPLRGRFEAGVGEFHGSDTFAGRPIRVRFHWKDITPASAVWQQAFSDDDGATWETNWVMRFTRAR